MQVKCYKYFVRRHSNSDNSTEPADRHTQQHFSQLWSPGGGAAAESELSTDRDVRLMLVS